MNVVYILICCGGLPFIRVTLPSFSANDAVVWLKSFFGKESSPAALQSINHVNVSGKLDIASTPIYKMKPNKNPGKLNVAFWEKLSVDCSDTPIKHKKIKAPKNRLMSAPKGISPIPNEPIVVQSAVNILGM